MEVVLPGTMSVKESHDIALILQHKLEAFDEVERAFVHGTFPPPLALVSCLINRLSKDSKL